MAGDPFGAPIKGWNTRAYSKAFGSRDPMTGRISDERIKMRSGNIFGIGRIGAALERARFQAKEMLVEELGQWIQRYVPRSDKQHTHMEDIVLNYLKSSTDEVIRIGAPDVSYAGYVNEMNPPIHWTKLGSAYHWFTKLYAKAESRLPTLLSVALRQAGLAGSKGPVGLSAGAMAEAIIEQ